MCIQYVTMHGSVFITLVLVPLLLWGVLRNIVIIVQNSNVENVVWKITNPLHQT